MAADQASNGPILGLSKAMDELKAQLRTQNQHASQAQPQMPASQYTDILKLFDMINASQSPNTEVMRGMDEIKHQMQRLQEGQYKSNVVGTPAMPVSKTSKKTCHSSRTMHLKEAHSKATNDMGVTNAKAKTFRNAKTSHSAKIFHNVGTRHSRTGTSSKELHPTIADLLNDEMKANSHADTTLADSRVVPEHT